MVFCDRDGVAVTLRREWSECLCGSGTAFTLEGHRGIATALLSIASSLHDLKLR